MDAGTIATFDPTSDPEGFRGALGRFVTGVTIVTTQTENGPVGIVANSFASVSLDPPLVLWSPAKGTQRFEHFANARHYAIHVLSNDQRDICAAVIKSMDAVADIATQEQGTQAPFIPNSLARFECKLVATHDAGDHVIVVGEVIRAHHRDGDPLVFHDGRYGRLAANV